MPGVSVVIPVYNREKYLRECIQSVLDQECDFPVEIIVADDGSTDRGLEIARSFGSPVVVLEKPADCKTQGPGSARNRAIAASQYPYIAFLDSDDLYLSGHLQRLYDVLERNPEAVLVVDRLCGMDGDIEKRWLVPYPDNETVKLESVFLNPYVSLIVTLLRRQALVGMEKPFDESLVMAEDIDFFLKLLEKGRGLIVEGEGTVVREHGERSIRNIRRTYEYAVAAMQKAIVRFPYPKRLIRKRKAVLQFRFAQADLAERQYGSAVVRLFHAFLLDPIRAIKTLCRQKTK